MEDRRSYNYETGFLNVANDNFFKMLENINKLLNQSNLEESKEEIPFAEPVLESEVALDEVIPVATKPISPGVSA